MNGTEEEWIKRYARARDRCRSITYLNTSIVVLEEIDGLVLERELLKSAFEGRFLKRGPDDKLSLWYLSRSSSSSQHPVSVFCSGAQSILDIPRTLEYLETSGVPVSTFSKSGQFPAFYTADSDVKSPKSAPSTKQQESS
ncbi:hypothetical protein L7F22_048074 [Adiantum nelumboides]|nr:hypothetical protein [Adiantum nelumboides]